MALVYSVFETQPATPSGRTANAVSMTRVVRILGGLLGRRSLAKCQRSIMARGAPRGEVLLRGAPLGQGVGARRTVTPAPPQAIADHRGQRRRCEQHEEPGGAVSLEELGGAVPDQVADGDPRDGVHDRADEVERDELAVADVAATRQRGGEEPDAGREAAEQDGGGAPSPEIADRPVDAVGGA